MRNLRRLPVMRLGASVLAGVLALVLSPASTATPSSGATAEPARAASTVRIATFNAAATSTTRQGFLDVKELLSRGPDIVALQEMSNPERRQRVRNRLVDCDTCLWDGWFPLPILPGGMPILWRADKFTLIGHDWFEMAPETYVGAQGAGPATIRPRYVVRLRLRDNVSGRIIWVLNTHFVPTVEGPDGARNSNLRRTRLYAEHMRNLQAMVDRIRNKEGGGLIFVAGDFNVNYRKDKIARDPIFPYAAMGSRHLRASYYKLGEPATGTHELDNGYDKRLIDYVHFRPSRRTTALRQQIVRGMHSDHRPLIVDFKISARSS